MNISAIASIIEKDLKKVIRDKEVLLFVIFPLLGLILIFSILSFSPTDINIVIYNEDEQAKSFVSSLKEIEILEIEEIENWNTAIDYVRSGKSIAAIKIPSEFTKRLNHGEEVELNIVYDDRNLEKLPLILSTIKERGREYVGSVELIKLDSRGVYGANIFEIFFSFFVLLDIIWLGAWFTVSLISSEKKDETIKAILVMPVRYLEIVVGKISASIILVLITCGIIIFASPILGVNIKGNILYMLILILLTSFFFVNIGACIATIFKTEENAENAVFVFFIISIMPSLPRESLPNFLLTISKYYPLSLARRIMDDVVIAGIGPSQHLIQLAVLIFADILTLLFAAYVLKKYSI